MGGASTPPKSPSSPRASTVDPSTRKLAFSDPQVTALGPPGPDRPPQDPAGCAGGTAPLEVGDDVGGLRDGARVTVGGDHPEGPQAGVGQREPGPGPPPPGSGQSHQGTERRPPQVGPAEHG